MKKQWYLPGLLGLCLLWIALSLFAWTKPVTDISSSERRKLAQRPTVDLQSILTASFMNDFETYAQDQFPLRDVFRSGYALASHRLLFQRDVHGIYLTNGYAVKQEYPLNLTSIEGAAQKLDAIYRDYLSQTDCKVYSAIVPEKGYFLAEDAGQLSLDYGTLLQQFCSQTPFADYIDIWGNLTAESYYKTDPHWRQESLLDVSKQLGDSMGIPLSQNYETEIVKKDFQGLYPSQSGLTMHDETIAALTNTLLEGCIVTNYETNQVGGVYDSEKLNGRDPYDYFLSGACALMTIENPKATTERELVLFRDSFGSSLAPLLMEGYRKITLIDTRYIAPALIGSFVEFTNQDVLFLYSATLLNNSTILKS